MLSKLTLGYSEYVYTRDDSVKAEIELKINRQINRITQPTFDKLVIDWGDCKQHMKLQSPSENIVNYFYRGGKSTLC